ncbi:MAG: hypothetical protein OEW75_10775 [Cyclobacteriaceae bacterium]|nr:hypothetical protein [Cyclobacteriaceae bacterium]
MKTFYVFLFALLVSLGACNSQSSTSEVSADSVEVEVLMEEPTEEAPVEEAPVEEEAPAEGDSTSTETAE